MDGDVTGIDGSRRKTVVRVFLLFLVFALLASVAGTLLVALVLLGSGGMGRLIGADGGYNPALIKYSTMATMVLTPLFTVLPVLTRKTRMVTDSNGGLGLGVHGLSVKMGTKTEAGAWAKSVGVGVLTAAVTMIILEVVGTIGNWVSSMLGAETTSTNQTTQAVMDYLKAGMADGDVWLMVVLMALTGVIGPFVEEVVFRGVIARSLQKSSILVRRFGDGKMRTFLVCMVSGLLFGLAHLMSTDLSFSWMTLLTVLITWFLGSVLSWFASVRFDSLWPGIFTHVTYNMAGLLISLL